LAATLTITPAKMKLQKLLQSLITRIDPHRWKRRRC
jgi:hypothetical protein